MKTLTRKEADDLLIAAIKDNERYLRQLLLVGHSGYNDRRDRDIEEEIYLLSGEKVKIDPLKQYFGYEKQKQKD